MWFRRDLRLGDNPALALAASVGPVVPLFVLDPLLLRRAGAESPRVAFLAACLAALDDALGGRLVVRTGDPRSVVPAVASGAPVFAASDFGPYGRARDAAVASAVDLRLVGSPYAVPPGTVVKGDGTPYRVFTPFSKAWRAMGWPPPTPAPSAVACVDDVSSEGLASLDAPCSCSLPLAGEVAAGKRLDAFLDGPVSSYKEERDFPGRAGTSRLSADLRWGTLHPRTILARLPRGASADVFRTELAWREFYADVLVHAPSSAREHWNPAFDRIRYDSGAAARRRFEAWSAGMTGYPIVDAGMRQLAGEAWMHNRVRMIVASFLVKDLHCPWRWGARWFMQHLVDGDLASNQHGWQWVAGSGTDAAPYFRVFNPVAQGAKFDPDGSYVRRWVPELAAVQPAVIHDPVALEKLRGRLDSPEGLDRYPSAIVDHAAEREEALDRYQATRR